MCVLVINRLLAGTSNFPITGVRNKSMRKFPSYRGNNLDATHLPAWLIGRFIYYTKSPTRNELCLRLKLYLLFMLSLLSNKFCRTMSHFFCNNVGKFFSGNSSFMFHRFNNGNPARKVKLSWKFGDLVAWCCAEFNAGWIKWNFVPHVMWALLWYAKWAARRFLLKRSACECWGYYGDVVTCFTPSSKQNSLNSRDLKIYALSEYIKPGTEKVYNTLSFKAYTVALAVALRTGTNQKNLGYASKQTKMTELPVLLRRNFPTKWINPFSRGRCSTSEVKYPSWVFWVGLLRAHVWQSPTLPRISRVIFFHA